jgi:peptidoglycan hydrolase CwlO-like protein
MENGGNSRRENMKFIFIALMATVVSVFTYAVTKEEVQKKSTEAASAAVEYSKEQKEQFQKEMGSKLEELTSEVSDLKKKALQTTGNAQKQLSEQINLLEKKEHEMKKDLASLSKSTGKSWEQMKSGVNKAWDSLSESYQKAKKEFKKD